jgi:oligopeptide/dipeptide ABC transporter ATP-binding protein
VLAESGAVVADLLEVEDVRKNFAAAVTLFGRRPHPVLAVDGVTFSIAAGMTFGLVGESGSGKTTVARMCLGLLPPTSGVIRFMGEDLFGPRHQTSRAAGGQIGAVFQDPYSALNPRKRVRDIVSLPLRLHGRGDDGRTAESVVRLLEAVSLTPGARYLDRYPHELSGGQRQRVVIARAIALRPRLVVADEPVSALDMSTRAQILGTLAELKKTYNLTYLYITHDLGVVRSICDRVGVMYLGKLVEVTGVEELYARPLHPYTKLLLEANPIPRPTQARARQRGVIRGEIPSPSNPPSGCRFHPRCPMAEPRCALEEPKVVSVGGTLVACHLYAEGGRQ